MKYEFFCVFLILISTLLPITNKPIHTMLNQKELNILLKEPKTTKSLDTLRTEFAKKSPKSKEISDEDFISLVLLAPSLGIALAHGSISLFEELSLNKKVRSLSNKSKLLKNDALFYALRFLKNNFPDWEDNFYQIIKLVLYSSLKKNTLIWDTFQQKGASTNNLQIDVLNAPYIFVKLMTFLFLEDSETFISKRSIAQTEYEKILEIGDKLELSNVPLFQQFCEGFDIR